ncbi:redoxin domain-containing protein [Terriglobus roseus]|uniref:Peroxiredoxin n=1 Tax=Terriglobus roseus TaxID=392734 RepID=A0A1H4JZH5_9BACT|nr:redoxin domain-containing protein [Terriglobus roseus]SEB51245.1 Peroxiredoxin [Terriglobus roseus]
MRSSSVFLLATLAVTFLSAPAQDTPPAQKVIGVSELIPMGGNAEHPLLPIGSTAPDFALKGTDDKVHTLAEFKDAKVLVVMFESIHCPVSENYEGRMRGLYDSYRNKGVAFVAINPNNPKAVRLDELGYTDLTDSPADMKIRVHDRQIPWPYLYDGETQAIAQKFGAVATPHVFIFDADRKLRYEGRIDDNQNEKLVKVHDAHDAIEALLAGGTVATPHRPAFGCSTKWLSKSGDVEKEMERIKAEPVALNAASAADLAALRANAGNKVTVIHFWSTGTPNGAKDFAELETTFRMYRGRSYDFVTVDTDAAANTPKATEFLNSQHASSRNLQLSSADMKTVQAAFGDTWRPNEEFTAVLAPGGKLVYAHKGPIDILDVRHAVLTNFTDNPHFPGQSEYWATKAR